MAAKLRASLLSKQASCNIFGKSNNIFCSRKSSMSFVSLYKTLLRRNNGPWFCSRTLSYKQGQSPKRNTREYFYYVDHQGQLFLDDARVKNFISCFKEKDFLAFFFSRVRINQTGRYQDDFPYYSPCGVETNYVRCDDLPIVYTHIITKTVDNSEKYFLAYGGAGDKLTVNFEPEKLCMLPESGRVYHPAHAKCGGIGLVKSKLAIELSQFFKYEDNLDATSSLSQPSEFVWKGVTYKLTNELLNLTKSENR